MQSLETKWGIIGHDVAKFVEVYNQVLPMRGSKVLPDDMLERKLQFYKVKHPKQQSFDFIRHLERCTTMVGVGREVLKLIASWAPSTTADAEA
jgi:hypothetical protein